jgi:murein DD-endopeptidase MepM/ murein hydrolase activator NlpD
MDFQSFRSSANTYHPVLYLLLLSLPLLSNDHSAIAQSSGCRELANSVVPGACLGQFQHGTLVRKIGSGANEDLELASGPSGAVLTHPGVDLVADCGSPIYALADGVVVDTISDSSDHDFPYLGYMVRLKHAATPTGLPLPATQMVETETLYIHMQDPPSVQVGSVVLERSSLGKVGRTGAAWGCHTHFEVRHFAGRYMTDPSWNSPMNIYGRGDQTSGKLFKEKWSNPVQLLSQLPATLEATGPLSLELSVKATTRDYPPLSSTYTDVGACPGEGCRYGSIWTLDASTPVHPTRGSSQIAFDLPQGQKVTTVTGVVVTKPGRIRILHPIVIPGQHPVSSGVLYVLTYRGEGFWKVWLNGKLIDAVSIPEVLSPIACNASEASCKEKYEAKWISDHGPNGATS